MSKVQSSGEATTPDDQTARWRTTKEAAPFLGMSERVLRDTLTKHAKSVGDMTEARFDGIVGCKVGRRWKVWLSEKWTAPHVEQGKGRGQSGRATVHGAENAGHGGKEADHARA